MCLATEVCVQGLTVLRLISPLVGPDIVGALAASWPCAQQVMCFCAVPAMVLEDSDVELQQAAGSARRRPVLDSDSEKSPALTEATGNVMLQRKRARADPAALQACPPPN